MGILVIVVSLLVQVIAHEAGHAAAIRGYGMKVVEAGLGFGRPRLAVRWRGVVWTLSPWLLGAYVNQDKKEAEHVRTGPYARLAWIMNSGVLVNLVIGAACLSVSDLIGGLWWTGAGMAAVAALTVLFYRQVAAYVIPALGPIILVAVLWVVGKGMAHGEVTGLTGLSALIAPHITLRWVLWINGMFGFSLFVLNAAPLGGTDGGQVWRRILHDRFGRGVADWTTLAGLGLLVVMLGYSVIRDLLNIIL